MVPIHWSLFNWSTPTLEYSRIPHVVCIILVSSWFGIAYTLSSLKIPLEKSVLFTFCMMEYNKIQVIFKFLLRWLKLWILKAKCTIRLCIVENTVVILSFLTTCQARYLAVYILKVYFVIPWKLKASWNKTVYDCDAQVLKIWGSMEYLFINITHMSPLIRNGELGIPLHCHYSQVTSNPEWLYLLGYHLWLKERPV